MPPRKTQTSSVIKEPLRKHGAETESKHRRSTTPVANESLSNTSSRLEIVPRVSASIQSHNDFLPVLYHAYYQVIYFEIPDV
jgi:hypothetical protein